jgi:hypothetical protein
VQNTRPFVPSELESHSEKTALPGRFSEAGSSALTVDCFQRPADKLLIPENRFDTS